MILKRNHSSCIIKLVCLAQKVQKLHAPARYELYELLEELKYGRPAVEQNWLDKKIKELKANRKRSFVRSGQTEKRDESKVEQINKWLEQYSIQDPAHPQYDSVAILFSDGEIVITKAGRLFGQRDLHVQRRAVQKLPPEGIKWPNRFGKYECVIIEGVGIANALYDMIWGSESITPLERKREEALEEIHKKIRENKEKQPKPLHPKDVLLKLGFKRFENPHNRYEEIYQKGGIKAYFEDDFLKAIDVPSLPKPNELLGGAYYDAYWYSIVTPDSIWIHQEGWFNNKELRRKVKEIRDRSGSSNSGFRVVEQTTPEELEFLGFTKVA